MVKRKMVDEESLRDYWIKKKYADLRKKKVSGKLARAKLAEEFCTGEENIQRILYRKK